MSPGIESAPKPGLPYWTAYTDLEGNSEPSDPLRFEMYAQRLGNILLPGITNRTERLRYMSMVCAGIAETTHGSERTIREQRAAFLPFERGWALAMTVSVNGDLKAPPDGQATYRRLKPEFRGFRGTNRVLAHYRQLGDRPRFSPNRYDLLKSQDAQGGLGVYLVALRAFGFVQPETMSLTAAGQSLAQAFDPTLRGAALHTLSDPRPAKRRTLHRLGEALRLDLVSDEERRLLADAMFERAGNPVTECVARMRAAQPGTSDPRTLLQGIANRRGDTIGTAAQFAVDFDPFRVALLQLFARVGRQLSDRPGTAGLTAIATEDLESAAADARKAAKPLASNTNIPGLEPVLRLARDVADGESLADTVRATIGFHRQEGRSWIVSERANRYAVGQHGSFDEPATEFNGYTVGRAMELVVESGAKR